MEISGADLKLFDLVQGTLIAKEWLVSSQDTCVTWPKRATHIRTKS